MNNPSDNQQPIRLHVLGISRSQVQAGAYALLLENADATPVSARRIPVVVGTSEAQSIAMRLENIIPPRPLTHDLITSMMHVFGLQLDYVNIYSFKDGVFSAMLHMSSHDREVDIDARTSDAVALALRTDCPIYTTSEVMRIAGYDWTPDEMVRKPRTLEDLSDETLERRLQRYVEKEQYEKAAEVQKILVARRSQNPAPPNPEDE